MHGFWAGTNAMRYDNFYCIPLDGGSVEGSANAWHCDAKKYILGMVAVGAIARAIAGTAFSIRYYETMTCEKLH